MSREDEQDILYDDNDPHSGLPRGNYTQDVDEAGGTTYDAEHPGTAGNASASGQIGDLGTSDLSTGGETNRSFATDQGGMGGTRTGGTGGLTDASGDYGSRGGSMDLSVSDAGEVGGEGL